MEKASSLPATTAANYLRDLGYLIRENAVRVRTERDQAVGTADYDYQRGRLMAYNEVVSLMQTQALVFGISLEAVNLAGIDPDNDLM